MIIIVNILIANEQGAAKDSFLPPEVLAEYYRLGTVTENPHDRNLTKSEFKELIKDKDVVVTGWGCEPIDIEILENANRLKLHAHVGGSVAAYTSKEAFERGITVLSGNEIFARSVAEGCITYFLFALRNINIYIDSMKKDGWAPEYKHMYDGLSYKKIGLVGYGAITKYLCELLRVFKVEILIYSAHEVSEEDVKQASLEEIFETCDIISLHSAWNKKTEGMITKKHLSLIKNDALFVNTARAHIVKKEDLYEELSKERFYSVFDVYYEEPLPLNDPIRNMEKVMLMPHSAGPTLDSRKIVGSELLDDIKRFFDGKPCINQITPERASRMTIEKR